MSETTYSIEVRSIIHCPHELIFFVVEIINDDRYCVCCILD